MKNVMMKLFALVVRIIILVTMALMIFSLRSENAKLRAAVPNEEEIVLKTIATRTSVRRYDPSKPISAERMRKLLEAAFAAPSAMNRQPWAFMVIEDKATLAKIAETNRGSRMCAQAAAAILVCGKAEDPARDVWKLDCAAATENILLAAHAMGLGACWNGVNLPQERQDAVREICGVPPEYIPLSLVALGYPAENPLPKEKWDDAKIHFEKW